MPAGRYTVVLEPAAVLDLAGQMFGDFSATAIRDGRSFLNDRIGKKIFGENITIHDDARHPLQSGAPFDGEGVPRQAADAGGKRRRARDRLQPAGRRASPASRRPATASPCPTKSAKRPSNIVIAGGDTSVEQMIASTERGILVTRFWYIREVDPYEKIFTGMTRDGTFLIEDGQRRRAASAISASIEGLMEMLSNVEALSPTVRASGEEAFDMVVPAMKVRDFNFTEVTRF